VNRFDDAPPSPDLIIRINAGRGGIAASGRHHRRGFGDDQAARRGSLGRNIPHSTPAARKLDRSGPHPRKGAITTRCCSGKVRLEAVKNNEGKFISAPQK